MGDDGGFEFRLGPGKAGPGYFTLGPGSAMLIVREVYSDWATERRGTIRIRRADQAGCAPPAATDTATAAKRYAVAGKLLLSRLRTFLAFPEWFYLNEPANTLTPPRATPGGLATQFSSAGHFDLADDEAMLVTVPAAARRPRRTRASSSAACGTSRSTTSTTRPASPPTRRGSTPTAGCAS